MGRAGGLVIGRCRSILEQDTKPQKIALDVQLAPCVAATAISKGLHIIIGVSP